tara:strand:+ start:39 stop:515 length:477 start_codon:yes stop_codon:yes gene_type:complete
MMKSPYTEFLRYVKSKIENDSEYVNTITNKGSLNLDDNKGTIYPIFDVFVDSIVMAETNVILINATIACVNQRDTNKQETNTDNFFGNDNEVDNLNETLMEVHRVWGQMADGFNELGITASKSPTAEPILEEGKNLHDGWGMSITVEVPIGVTLCDGC